MEEKKNYKGKSRNYSIDVQKKSLKKYNANLKSQNKIRFEIVGLESNVRDEFNLLKSSLSISSANLLKEMIEYCNNDFFKNKIIEKINQKSFN